MSVEARNITIVGAGRTGIAAARYFTSRGASVFVTDSGNAPLADTLRAEGIAIETGGHTSRALDCDTMVLSPGVPTDIPLIQQARDKGIPVVSELEAVWADAHAPIIAVTGTNGKTTTTALIHHILTSAGLRSILCGNNDLPLSEALRTLPTPDWYVMEVSSYQLETAHTFRPRIAAVLNVTPDHPRHGSLHNYARIKESIFSQQQHDDTAVLNHDDHLVNAMQSGAEVLRFSIHAESGVGIVRGSVVCKGSHVLPIEDIPLPGSHNLSNTLAAIAITHAAGVAAEDIADAIRTFRAVPHRIEHVRHLDGVDYYNDSKSTNVDSLRVALEAFTRPIVLIAGGRGKDSDYTTLTPLIREHTRALVVIGEDAPKMAAAWADAMPTLEAPTMADAVAAARALAQPGDVVLLSPGCASFDWYNNFEERGEDFRACVTALAANTNTSMEASAHGA